MEAGGSWGKLGGGGGGGDGDGDGMWREGKREAGKESGVGCGCGCWALLLLREDLVGHARSCLRRRLRHSTLPHLPCTAHRVPGTNTPLTCLPVPAHSVATSLPTSLATSLPTSLPCTTSSLPYLPRPSLTSSSSPLAQEMAESFLRALALIMARPATRAPTLGVSARDPPSLRGRVCVKTRQIEGEGDCVCLSMCVCVCTCACVRAFVCGLGRRDRAGAHMHTRQTCTRHTPCRMGPSCLPPRAPAPSPTPVYYATVPGYAFTS